MDKERIVFVDRPVEVVREVKIINIEKLMLVQAEIRNLKDANRTLKWLLFASVILCIYFGVR